MIEIAIVSRQGAAIGSPMAAQFGPTGGTIGRAASNTLVLDDPDRTVSRVHAQVLVRDGRYFIVDRGSNPMHCDGRPLGSGNEAPLRGGERLVIGSFELKVEAMGGAGATAIEKGAPSDADPFMPLPLPSPTGQGSADDPFSDLLADLEPAAAVGSAAPVGGRAQANRGTASDPVASFPPDPFDTVTPAASSRGSASDPFADLLGSSGDGGAAASGSFDHAAFDDFSDIGGPSAPSRSTDIDALFGLGGGLGGDPLALSPLADPLRQPNTASDTDPLAAFGRDARPTAAPRGDHLPIGHFGFEPPASQAPRAKKPPSAPEATAVSSSAPEVAPQTPGVLLFGDKADLPFAPTAVGDPFAGLLDGVEIAQLSAATSNKGSVAAVAPAPSPLAHGPVPVSMTAPAPKPAPAPAQRVAAPAPSPTSAAMGVGASAAALEADLLAAFLRGLAATHQAPTSLTPELMERVGTMLRSATEGTLQLLLARQEFKREVRAEVTIIASQANNPLKFSPTVDVALAHLLGPGVRGFMPAETAMRDAFNDLRAHQFGVMVGLRAALAHALARFEPAVLERKISAKSKLDTLFTANRKAKLWDQFVNLYADIATEAEDDFHSLFGKAFLQAYEEQMARFKDAEKP